MSADHHHHDKHRCKLEDGRVVSYHAAFPKLYDGFVADELIQLGYGTICSCDGKPIAGNRILKFYATIRMVHGDRAAKHYNRRKRNESNQANHGWN